MIYAVILSISEIFYRFSLYTQTEKKMLIFYISCVDFRLIGTEWSYLLIGFKIYILAELSRIFPFKWHESREDFKRCWS